jgi:hypothetical protein
MLVGMVKEQVAAKQAMLMLQTQVAVTKKVMDVNNNLQQQLLQQLMQVSLNNNPSNTGNLLNIRV